MNTDSFFTHALICLLIEYVEDKALVLSKSSEAFSLHCNGYSIEAIGDYILEMSEKR